MTAWLKLRVLPPVGAGVIRLFGVVLRPRTVGAERVDDVYRRGHRVIIAFWHGRQLMMPLAHAGRPTYVLVSQHQDGEIIARIIARFGFQAVRGSTTRGGTAALRELIRLGRSGADLAVTPDGPKGPRHVAQAGVVQLARATGMPVVPLGFGCSKKNSSRAGTGSWSRCHSAVACMCGAIPSGCRRRVTPEPSKRNAARSSTR